MKRNAVITLLIVFCSSLQLFADDYKILQMNSKSIKIGKVFCSQGDIFSEDNQIFWTNDKQAMKAMNLRTKQIKAFTAKAFISNQARSVKDYYVKINHLSSRGMISFTDLAEELSDTLYLYDAIPIESPQKKDSLSSYVISYGKEEKKWRTLMSTDKHFFLCRELFEDNGDMEEFHISLYFRNKMLEEDYLITDELIVVLLPLQIEE